MKLLLLGMPKSLDIPISYHSWNSLTNLCYVYVGLIDWSILESLYVCHNALRYTTSTLIHAVRTLTIFI